MRIIVFLLLRICNFSSRFPVFTMAVFLLLGAAGYAVMPYITISTNIIAGVGEANPVIRLTQENHRIFGEQDALIVVLEFPEPPTEARLALIQGLAGALGELKGVRRVRYRFLDPEDLDHLAFMLRQFLLGMNDKEREGILKILTPQGVEDAVRRNTNRLFLTENPYVQHKILEDPLELGQFVAASMEKRVGALSLGDLHLLIASPDSTLFLIQITPDFPSSELVQGEKLLAEVRSTIPAAIKRLGDSSPEMGALTKDLNWSLTGKTEFQRESDVIFDDETMTILACSITLVTAILLFAFRSVFSLGVLMVPLLAGIGPNYILIYASYPEVNPVVMATMGVLLALGAEYGVHMWARFTDEIDAGRSVEEALQELYKHTGPAVLLGAANSSVAFLCLCLSDQPAMAQFGYVGAVGLILTFLSTVFLIPALASLLARLKKDRFPRMRASFSIGSTLYQRRPKFIVASTAVLVLVSVAFATKVTYEKDLFKVFLARDMKSMAVSEMISRKLNANFTQPTVLSFDVADLEEGLKIQRSLDSILEGLMRGGHEIVAFDSISYLMSPESAQRKNIEALAPVIEKWPELKAVLEKELKASPLSASASQTMRKSFDWTGENLKGLKVGNGANKGGVADIERSWYLAKVKDKWRFLTQIRYSENLTDAVELQEADRKTIEATKGLPVEVKLSGTRQVMEQILSSLVSELFRLGAYGYLAVIVVFLLAVPHPLGVVLCLLPMTGAFCVTLGIMGAVGIGLPFSIVAVAPLIFGLGIDNGIHVVMGSLYEGERSVAQTMKRVWRPVLFANLTSVMGFVAMLTSKHYSLQFLGLCMVLGSGFTVLLAMVTLPALLLLLERRRGRLDKAAARE